MRYFKSNQLIKPLTNFKLKNKIKIISTKIRTVLKYIPDEC